MNKALFIDIDGVVIYDPGYLSKPEELRLLPQSDKALRLAVDKGFLLVFISNKGGAFLKKGLTSEGLTVLDLAFKNLLTQVGVDKNRISTYYCPHYSLSPGRAGLSENKPACSCRKPATALFDKAVKDFSIDPRQSNVIGDKLSDLKPGMAIGCKKAVLVKRNQEYFDLKKGEKSSVPYRMVTTLLEAVNIIIPDGIPALSTEAVLPLPYPR